MCRIKTGKNIVSQADVRNLVTALIFRQTNIFSSDTIVELTRKYTKNSCYKFTDKELNELVDNRLDLYCRNKELKCSNGLYIGTPI